MKKLLLVITLLAAAVPAMAAQTPPVGDGGNPLVNATLSAITSTPGLLAVMVTFKNLNGYTDTTLAAFGGQIYLTAVTGGTSPTFVGDSALTNGKANSVMNTDVAAAGGIYAFPTFDMAVTTANETPANKNHTSLTIAASENQDVADDYSNPVNLASIVGEVGFIAYFTYTGSPTSVTVNLGGESGNGSVGHLTDAYLADDGTVTNGNGGAYNTLDVQAPAIVVPLTTPEPATMGLLGLGLAGLIARRKKA